MEETTDLKKSEKATAVPITPPPQYPTQATPYSTQATPYPTQATPYPTQASPYPVVYKAPEAVTFLQGQGQGQVMFIQQQQPTGPPPNDCLLYAIFTLLCCFWPLGLVAVIRSVQCRSALRHGDMLEAGRLAKRVRCLANAALIVGIITNMIFVAAQILTNVHFDIDDYHGNWTLHGCLNCTTAMY